MKRERSPGREAVIARARRWRELRDRARLKTVRLAILLGLTAARCEAILCARSMPTDAEANDIDALLSALVQSGAR